MHVELYRSGFLIILVDLLTWVALVLSLCVCTGVFSVELFSGHTSESLYG